MSADRSTWSAADVARHYYAQRLRIAADADILRTLIRTIAWPNDLASTQWAQWYSIVLGFEPDLILELGRGHGNSTALFCQAAARLGGTRVVSLCHSGDWSATVARLAPVVDSAWFSRLDARTTDIRSVDFEELIGESTRVLVLWDAHGFEIAEIVLGAILPVIANRPHVVLLHDIVDNRYANVSRSYEHQPLWKGSHWQQRTGFLNSRVNIGWMHAIQDQVIAVADFSSRNDLEIGSGDHEYHQFFGSHPEYAEEMRKLLTDEFFSLSADWAFLSLTGARGPFHFPSVEGRQPFGHRCAAIVDQPISGEVVTRPQPWDYASVLAWRAGGEIPSNARVWMRVTLQVEGGAVGIGLLSQGSNDFAVRQAVSSSRLPVTIQLPVDNPLRPCSLVIQTWDAPVSARVRIDDVSLVW